VHTVRSLLVHLQTPISRCVERALFERSNRITAVAGWVAGALGEYGVAVQDVAITGNGVEDRFLQADPADASGEYVLFVGRLEEGKGLLDMLAAAKLMEQSHTCREVRFVIVGDGPLLTRLQDMLAGTSLSTRFTFVGHIDAGNRDKLLQIYRHAKLFVLPSHHEGMPTVLLEAMACGLPVVACAVGGCRELIDDGRNGMLVPARQPGALAAALLLLMEDKDRSQALAVAARAAVQARYSWDSVVERYCACYERTLFERR
jgi:glycosyltransferase involved in cell wall biosynthesis